MEHEYVIKNGELIKKEDACISVYSKANFFDFAVYSNIKIVQGKMFMPVIEIEKLFSSAESIGIRHNFKKEAVFSWARALIEKNKIDNALLRMLLIGGDSDEEPILFIFPVGLTFYPKKLYRDGALVVTYSGERLFPKIKSKSLLLNYKAYSMAASSGAIDALLIDRDGNIAEGTRTSFFAIKENSLIMPPDDDVLHGVTREIVSQISEGFLEIKKEKIPFAKIEEYDEWLISNASMGIMPLRNIGEKKSRGTDFEKTKKLLELYRKYCEDKWI